MATKNKQEDTSFILICSLSIKNLTVIGWSTYQLYGFHDNLSIQKAIK